MTVFGRIGHFCLDAGNIYASITTSFQQLYSHRSLFEYILGGAAISSLFPLSNQRKDGHLRVCSCMDRSQKPLSAELSYDEGVGQPNILFIYLFIYNI